MKYLLDMHSCHSVVVVPELLSSFMLQDEVSPIISNPCFCLYLPVSEVTIETCSENSYFLSSAEDSDFSSHRLLMNRHMSSCP